MYRIPVEYCLLNKEMLQKVWSMKYIGAEIIYTNGARVFAAIDCCNGLSVCQAVSSHYMWEVFPDFHSWHLRVSFYLLERLKAENFCLKRSRDVFRMISLPQPKWQGINRRIFHLLWKWNRTFDKC